MKKISFIIFALFLASIANAEILQYAPVSGGGGGGGSPGGSQYDVQVNNGAGGFYGDGNFTYDYATGAVTTTNNTLDSGDSSFQLGSAHPGGIALGTVSNSTTIIGDWAGNENSTQILIDDNVQTIELGTIAGAIVDTPAIQLDDGAGNMRLISGNLTIDALSNTDGNPYLYSDSTGLISEQDLSNVNVSTFNNDAGYGTANPGDNISEFNNDVPYATFPLQAPPSTTIIESAGSSSYTLMATDSTATIPGLLINDPQGILAIDLSQTGAQRGLYAGDGTTLILDWSNTQNGSATQSFDSTHVYFTKQINESTLTASTALVADASKNIISSATTAQQIGWLSNITGDVQTSLNQRITNPLTTLGDTIYENSSLQPSRLAGNTTATKKFLTQTGNGSVSAAPGWNTIAGSDLPNPSASTLGGVQSLAAVTSKWINTISTSGVPSATQPAFTDISGTATTAQLPAGSLYGSNGTPTCGTGCGSITSGSKDVRGSATGGTLVTSIIVNFSTTLASAPFCTCSGSSPTSAAGCTNTSSALTINLSTALTGDVITWNCPL